ncbi:hypothetical protein HBH70_201870 [Parastagonospora nodorum]|nr:hypothetical protein HBH52_009790 [Parastagonospora nodorum]KAH4075137.1 hypothetical protein HBH50_034370 [Parastagonospora nodorum]KAH4097196.1 hypothetical protein HBH48_043240 [Parastagonospora nodorum]KAH4406347.1 hypothetical protein HBH92_166900 [Parastagonospora nodorum]KAH4431301.1 hypothetical protein HBH93_149560 [Parastagonospora nodorum]
MPSFAFWKNPKSSPSDGPSVREPLLDDVADAAQPKLDLITRNQDSGSFTFEDMERLADCQPTRPLQQLMERIKPSAASTTIGQVDEDAPLLDDEHIQSQCGPSPDERSEPILMPREEYLSADVPLLVLDASSETTTTVEKVDPESNSQPTATPWRDESKSHQWPLKPVSVVATPETPQMRPASFSTRSVSSQSPSTAAQAGSTPRRLHRPTELNLGSVAPTSNKPESELEKQFSLMRNSKTQSKAALRSPTQLLQERLSMSTTKQKEEVKVRVFVPPQPPRNGCLLPGPAGQMGAFSSTSVRARTEGGRPAWWCKTDKLVVFDGIDAEANGEVTIRARTSKGLSIARRRGDTETVVIPMNCKHCQEMLKRHEWKYDIQVCRRSVCWDCKERCKWEQEQEIKERAEASMEVKAERERADSVLQDDEPRMDDLVRKSGIEQCRPKSPIEAVGGIEERIASVGC